MSTKDWLHESLIKSTNNESITRNNREWKHFAGFSSCGSILAIYYDNNNYCVHAGDEWLENTEPILGYYDIKLNYDDLITEIAKTYDNIRANNK